MRSKIPGIRNAAYAALWAIQEDKLHAVLDFIDLRASGVGMTKEQLLARGIRPKMRAQAGPAFRAVGQIAVLPLRGVIAHHAGMEMQISGGTSTVAFARAFDEALNTPDVSAIVIDCDSPGGTVDGVPELAARIYAARGQGKQIIAAVNAHCHSAAYWLASQCDSICITPSGEAGDIGVMTIRTDCSAMEAKEGVTRTLIKAGKFKGEGNPSFAPSDSEIAAQAQRVDGMYAMFTADVAKGRGVTQSAVQGGMGEGRSLGAKLALQAGLVDRIETFEQTLGRLAGRPPARQLFSAQSKQDRLAALAAEIVADNELDDSQDIEECPECGTPMEMQDGAEVCPECGYTAPLSDGMVEDVSVSAIAAGAVPLPLVASRTVIRSAPTAPRVAAIPPDPSPTTPTTTQESTVPEPLAPDLNKIRADERDAARLEMAQRASDITALCEAHDIPTKAMNEFISSDKTVAAIGLEIAKGKREARAADPTIRVGADRQADRPFENLGQQLQAIAGHFGANIGGPVDKRLYATVSGASGNVGSDGGFLIQKEFATELLDTTIEGGDLLGQCDTHEVGANADGLEVVYLDETSRATGSRFGGVQVYRGAEADAATAKKPRLGKWEVRLEDIIGAAYITERLMQDAPSLQNVFQTGFMEEFRFTAENELVNGTGAGQMLGILNAGVKVKQAKESGQGTGTIFAENIMNMWTRVHPRARARGSWYYNVECEPQLQQMQIGTGTSAQLVYMPPGGLAGAKFGSIYGRPCVPIEYASGLTTEGDIFFADWSRYKVITKGGLQSDESIHVRFLNNERTFRWLTRINGAPKDKLPITPFKATDTNLKLSPFVTLATR